MNSILGARLSNKHGVLMPLALCCGNCSRYGGNKYASPEIISPSLVASESGLTNGSLPQPAICGDTICVKISEETYAKGLEAFKRNLCGRMVLSNRAIRLTQQGILLQNFISNGQW